MAKQYDHLNDRIKRFIKTQKIFFVATSTPDSRINLSPKGMDTFKVMDENRVLWLNVTGSGNETAAHLFADGRITIMFCSFKGAPMILRLYGKGKVIQPNDENWESSYQHFPNIAGARQIFDIRIEMVQTSCGMSIPIYEFKEDRSLLNDWAVKKGEDGIKEYWKEKNENSIDGISTHIKNSL